MSAGPAVRPAPAPSAAAVPTVGVEEEFFLLRPDGRTAGVAPDVLAALAPGVRATAEFARCQIELSTGICRELTAVGRELSASRGAVARVAADHGVRLAAVGTPPADAPGFAALTDDDRYRRLVATVPGVTGEEITCAGQVHVGMASRDLGVAVLCRLRPWLPVLLALAGNSPFWRGHDTGWSSHRFVVQRRWPTFLPPPCCAGAAEYDERVADLVASRAALDDCGVYFWARLSPRYPTVEVRIADTCLTVSDAVLLAGLCRALVMTAVADQVAGLPVPATPDRSLVAAGYGAARRGTSAVVVDPWLGGWTRVVALLPLLLATIGPALDATGDRALIESLLTARLRRGSGAHRQRVLRRGRPRAAFVQALADTAAGSVT
ncbi:carboxylate-amine ligase [Geodermatophilus sabuli]|uniref:Putative glutamate--cysteine ligase 2 n=1 Tax=Geodermatophilus sabuli TaxID=1564158 RepID=A0A285EH29_9ACTN|nr:YbdK family carboxylate-amine ligase [Geodermatophilus sabuli]MBB3084449.1 carboxylate-amine ligase [Geodermatophilus sabuli]SNX97356.1 carboxylate-amine ligase [Geodermatophilus sabuli]